MAGNTEVIGIAALVLALASRNTDTAPHHGGEIFRTPEIHGLLRDFHRMTDIMNRFDNLGQMALNPPQPPELPAPEELFSRAMPDLSNIIDTVAPIVSALGFGQKEESENDIF